MNGRPKILLVDHTAAFGGAELALLRLLREVDRTRFDCRVLLFADGPLAARLTEAGVPVDVLPLADAVASTSRYDAASALFRLGRIVAVLSCVWRLVRYLRARKIDLVHTQSLKSHLIGGMASRLAGRMCIWHLHIRIADDYMPSNVARVFRTLARTFPQYVIANSQSTLRSIQPYDPRHSWVVYPGIQLRDYAGAARAARDPSDPIVIGLIGRISSTKGQDVFLRAGAKVLRQFPNVRLQIIGSALFTDLPFEQEIRDLTENLGIARSVEFTGFVSDVTGRLRALDVFVLASTVPEPFGQIVVEAMAAGVPVVATNAGGVPEIVVDGESGLLVPPGDPDRMAEAICRLLNEPAEAARLARRGQQRAADHFTIERTAHETEAIYEIVLRRGENSAPVQNNTVE